MAKKLPTMAAASTTLLLLAILLPFLHQIAEAHVGVCYGKYLGDNLPSVQDVVNLYKSNGIGSMKIYAPDEEVLRAIRCTDIKLILDIPNGDDIIYIGANPKEAFRFVLRYVVPYASSIKYIAVGNEVPMDSPYAQWVGPAIQNVVDALNFAGLGDQIKVSTTISTSSVKTTWPPSDGEFIDLNFMGPVVETLRKNGAPLLVNVYTYFAYADPGNTGQISLDYILFRSTKPVFTDPNNGLEYYNLFDAMVDSVYAALSKVVTEMSANNLSYVGGSSSDNVVASETGWPSSEKFEPRHVGADGAATLENAETYYRNLINHVKQGTPLKPGPMEAYLFEMFDENRKPGDVIERHFGLFYPNMTPKYNLNFRSSSVDIM